MLYACGFKLSPEHFFDENEFAKKTFGQLIGCQRSFKNLLGLPISYVGFLVQAGCEQVEYGLNYKSDLPKDIQPPFPKRRISDNANLGTLGLRMAYEK